MDIYEAAMICHDPYKGQGKEPALDPPETDPKDYCEHGVRWEDACEECDPEMGIGEKE